MTYFRDCKCIEDVKEAFKRLAKELHPDNGGDAEAFKVMMNDYTTAFNLFKSVHRTETGETYTKETEETPEEFAEVIQSIIHLAGITIEIIGSWVWVTGNTYPYKDTLKDNHFFWSKTKKAWYYTGAEEKSRRRGRYTMEQVRSRYGSQTVKSDRVKEIA